MEFSAPMKVECHEYKPGDMFIIHVDEWMPDWEEVDELINRFRFVAQLPKDTPVLVFYRGMKIEVVHKDE